MFKIELSLFLIKLLNESYCVYKDRGKQMRKKIQWLNIKKNQNFNVQISSVAEYFGHFGLVMTATISVKVVWRKKYSKSFCFEQLFVCLNHHQIGVHTINVGLRSDV
jgi:hypothetical protein